MQLLCTGSNRQTAKWCYKKWCYKNSSRTYDLAKLAANTNEDSWREEKKDQTEKQSDIRGVTELPNWSSFWSFSIKLTLKEGHAIRFFPSVVGHCFLNLQNHHRKPKNCWNLTTTIRNIKVLERAQTPIALGIFSEHLANFSYSLATVFLPTCYE